MIKLIKKIWNHKVTEVHRGREIIRGRSGVVELHTPEVHKIITVGDIVKETLRGIGICICILLLVCFAWMFFELLGKL